ncbi:TPA: hypothetical protein DEP94_00675 [Candidatus Nomurabacteria bacterium]|nr:hypothetical protein [Candidatus Nomurabacteria bacterium]
MLIDVRTKNEYDDRHHDGAINIPLDASMASSINFPFEEEIILYCRSGARAEVAQHILKGKGYKNVSLLNNTGAY